MRGSVLFVCSANVCRSPLMKYTFLDAVPDAAAWSVSSAGVAASEGNGACEAALPFIRSDELYEQALTHHATQLDDLSLRADLVIVASRAERAIIAQHSPELRWRVFTLSEAVYLGRSAAEPCDGTETRPVTASEYAQLLDSQRGMLVLPKIRGQHRYLSGAEQPHPLDVPDAHHLRRRAHTRLFKRVRNETAELAAHLSGFRTEVNPVQGPPKEAAPAPSLGVLSSAALVPAPEPGPAPVPLSRAAFTGDPARRSKAAQQRRA